MKVAADYLKKGIVPEIEKWYNKQYLKSEDFITDTTLYFGISFEEMHREGPIRANWKPFNVEMPLIDHIINNDEVLKKHSIRQPEMYFRQFHHNNCAGMCVKAGKTHFQNLLRKDEKTFIKFMEQEIVISDYIRYTRQCKGKDYMFDDVWEFVTTGKKSAKIQHIIDTNKYRKNFNFGGRNKQYTFMKNLSLEELEKQPSQTDIFDWGGCGCFVSKNITFWRKIVMNLTFVEGRSLQSMEKIDCYYNIHKGGFSIRSNDKRNPHYNKVVAYASSVTLKNCEFKVSTPGLLRIRQNKRKAVCAFVRGYFVSTECEHDDMSEVYFNPYTTEQFIDVENNKAVFTASEVICIDKKCFAKIEPKLFY